jgi:hypothetical protein
VNQVKIQSRAFLGVVLAACIQLTISIANSSEADPFPTIALPVYHGGHGIGYSYNRSQGIKTLVYRVHTRFPAAEMVQFYDAALNGKGWKPSFETCQRHWASPEDGSMKTKFQARHLFTSWTHPGYKLQISLRLAFQPAGPQSRDEVLVQCRLQPQLDKSKHEKFIWRLKASGQYSEFSQKLNTYRQADGELDTARMARDIRNKTPDKNLVEYIQIMDEMKQETDDIIRRVNETC